MFKKAISVGHLSNSYCENLCFIRIAPVITYRGDDARLDKRYNWSLKEEFG